MLWSAVRPAVAVETPLRAIVVVDLASLSAEAFASFWLVILYLCFNEYFSMPLVRGIHHFFGLSHTVLLGDIPARHSGNDLLRRVMHTAIGAVVDVGFRFLGLALHTGFTK